jgi:hypothetical protein
MRRRVTSVPHRSRLHKECLFKSSICTYNGFGVLSDFELRIVILFLRHSLTKVVPHRQENLLSGNLSNFLKLSEFLLKHLFRHFLQKLFPTYEYRFHFRILTSVIIISTAIGITVVSLRTHEVLAFSQYPQIHCVNLPLGIMLGEAEIGVILVEISETEKTAEEVQADYASLKVDCVEKGEERLVLLH